MGQRPVRPADSTEIARDHPPDLHRFSLLGPHTSDRARQARGSHDRRREFTLVDDGQAVDLAGLEGGQDRAMASCLGDRVSPPGQATSRAPTCNVTAHQQATRQARTFPPGRITRS
jgi:hypothetical protein